jgi:hypothetical protein
VTIQTPRYVTELVIAPGEVTKTVSIAIVNDRVAELRRARS